MCFLTAIGSSICYLLSKFFAKDAVNRIFTKQIDTISKKVLNTYVLQIYNFFKYFILILFQLNTINMLDEAQFIELKSYSREEKPFRSPILRPRCWCVSFHSE